MPSRRPSGTVCAMPITRRELLGLAAAGGALLAASPRRAFAIGDSSMFRFGHLQLGASWNPRPTALARVAWEIDKRTSIAVDTEARVVTSDSSSLHETPFLYLAGDREFSLPAKGPLDRLRRFLTFGGFLLIDSAEG